jgi:hypothetical protein
VFVCVSLLSLLGNGSVKCIPPFIARQRLCKHVPATTNTRNNKRIVERMCLWVCLLISRSLLGNSSVETLPRQRRIVGGIVLYAVRAVSKESRLLVLPSTSCYVVKKCNFVDMNWFLFLRSLHALKIMERFCKYCGTNNSVTSQLAKRLIQFHESSFEDRKMVNFFIQLSI